jgi:hypothetical protein
MMPRMDEAELLEFIRANGLARLETAVRQLQGFQPKRGVATLTWPGGSTSTDALAVAHGLGREPEGVVATAQEGSGTGFVAVMVTAKDATTFTLAGERPAGFFPAGGETTEVAWVAW